ncbi:MAG: hypothetical protein QM775_09070 [Pirellulales bacterium]
MRGLWRARAGKYEEGVADVVEAFKADDKNWTVNFFSALVYARKGTMASLQLAEARLKTCRTVDPKNTLAHVTLAILKSTSQEERFLERHVRQATRAGSVRSRPVAREPARAGLSQRRGRTLRRRTPLRRAGVGSCRVAASIVVQRLHHDPQGQQTGPPRLVQV